MLDTITKAYLSLRPASAARTLSRLDPPDIMETLEAMPPSLAASILNYLEPVTASQCLNKMDVQTCSDLLTRMHAANAVSTLRLMARSHTRQILATMPTARAAYLRMRMRFSESVIGSFADSDVVTISPEQRVSDALRLLRQNRARRTGHTIYVLDEQGKLVGSVDLAELLSAKESTMINRLIQPAPAVLNARAAFQTASNHPEWLTHDNLPVTNRDGSFQGVLWRSSITSREHQIINEVSEHNEMAVTRSALSDIFWIGVGAIFSSKPESSHDRQDH